ncbi:MAG TPA: hypothetical protein DCQ31_02655 [Bacteroidales bacterium]|nr:hypothetical protein [Bacteroidales bacterium]
MDQLLLEKWERPDFNAAFNYSFFLKNKKGGYTRTGIAYVNSYKDQGLLVCPLNGDISSKHVLVSSIEESYVENGFGFPLNFYRSPGKVLRECLRYIENDVNSPIISTILKTESIELKKEINLAKETNRLYVKYTLLKARSYVPIEIKPVLAFRAVDKSINLSNVFSVQTKPEENTVIVSHQGHYPKLHIQLNTRLNFNNVPEYFTDVEYINELNHGIVFREDLFIPGVFTVVLLEGQSFIMTIAHEPMTQNLINLEFENEYALRHEPTIAKKIILSTSND